MELDDDLAIHAVSEYCAPTVDYVAAIQYSNCKAHSMCDVSDALIIQAEQIAAASGVALKFDQRLIAKHPEFATLNELAKSHDADVWQWIFAGGEDHVFLATGIGLDGFWVGEVIAGSGVLGAEMKKAPDTWRHFN
jgi:thiamine-monophosphate kinase